MADRNDPYRQFRFEILAGDIKAGFSECTFADTTTDPVEYREGPDATYFRKLSGLTKYGNITLKWGITGNMDLYNWRKAVIATGAIKKRKLVVITLLDEEGKPAAKWNVYEAWPSKYDPPDFSAKGNEVAIETLELVHEHFERVQ
ncbi:MAG: phage tail protein [Candidatus Methanoperedens sp.]|nr:phage tail protein [Candidatus Methanoperedens sp.]CAG0963800.1 hypothetical protein METP1_00860 [Methanosarcinales archaeon]